MCPSGYVSSEDASSCTKAVGGIEFAGGQAAGVLAGVICAGGAMASLPSVHPAAHKIANHIILHAQVIGLLGQLNVPWSDRMESFQTGVNIANFEFKGFMKSNHASTKARRRLSMLTRAKELDMEREQLFPVLVVFIVLCFLILKLIWLSTCSCRRHQSRGQTPKPAETGSLGDASDFSDDDENVATEGTTESIGAALNKSMGWVRQKYNGPNDGSHSTGLNTFM